MKNRNLLLLIVGAIALMAVTAGASAYMTREKMTPPEPVQTVKATDTTTTATHHTARRENVNWNKPAPAPQPVQQVSHCDDGNIVGAGLGAVAGGLVGHQFGGGKGKDLATIGGAIAGGAAGHEYIPTRNTLCR